MLSDAIAEARRQAEICNACRYCEGYCAVFPAMFAKRIFADADLVQLANLCHNCRGCFYACQYTAPHVFALNLPAALADAQHESWKEFAWPKPFAHLFDRAGVAIAALLVAAFALLLWAAAALRPAGGAGFYAVLSHGFMVAVFTPAFVLPLLAIGVSLIRYWRFVSGDGGDAVRLSDLRQAIQDAASMRNLRGGHGDGCNFEDADKFSHARRVLHQFTVAGFMLCFAATCAGTVMHYALDLPAPYGLFSAPKLLGVPGGILLCIGSAGLAWLKTRADPALGVRAAKIWRGDMAFIVLLFSASATGLALYLATVTTAGTAAIGTVTATGTVTTAIDTVTAGTVTTVGAGATSTGTVVTSTAAAAAVTYLLPIHLATVLTIFLLTPYSKMAHGFYRITALIKDKARTRCA